LRGFAAAAGEANWRPIARCWIRTSRSFWGVACDADLEAVAALQPRPDNPGGWIAAAEVPCGPL